MKNLLLILASICFIIVIGGAVYEHIAVVPQWSAAPPRSLSMLQGDYALNPGFFWMSIHPLTLLFMISALIANWKNSRRKNILIVLGSYVLILIITSIYFVPELLEIIGTEYQDKVDEGLVQRSSLWETLSLIRLAFLFVLAYILLAALTIPMALVVVQQPTSVPLTYPNDSMGG